MSSIFLLPPTADRTKVTVNAFNRANANAGTEPDEVVIPLSEFSGDGGLPLPTNNTVVAQESLTQWNAGTALTQWQAVYLTSGGVWQLADANGSGTFPARGLVAAATANGAKATVIVKGHIRNDAWNWTVGGNLYLSETAGAITQTAPTASGSNVQTIGWADSPDSIILAVTPGFRLIP